MRSLLEQALAGVRADPYHELRLGMRRAIRRAWRGPDAGNPGDAAHRMWLRIESLAVEKVLPRWEAAMVSGDEPRAMLRLAERVLAGEVKGPEAERIAGSFWTRCDDLASRRGLVDQIPILVGYAAVRVVDAAKDENPERGEAIDLALRDSDLDPFGYDASYNASIVWSEGEPWNGSGDAARRLEFWEWWLGEASTVPIG